MRGTTRATVKVAMKVTLKVTTRATTAQQPIIQTDSAWHSRLHCCTAKLWCIVVYAPLSEEHAPSIDQPLVRLNQPPPGHY